MKVRQIARLTGHKGSIFTVVEGANPAQILSGAGDGWVIAWDLTDLERAKVVAKVETNIFSMAYWAAHNWLVVGNMHGGVHWIDLNEKADLRNLTHHIKGVFDIQIIDNQIVTAGGDGKLTRWDVAAQRPLETLQLTADSLRSVAYSPERREIAIGASDHSIYLLNLDFSLKKQIPKAHDNSVFCVKYSTDAAFLLSGGRDAHLKIWDINADFACVGSQPAHWFTLNSIAFHPNGRYFATASRDKTLKIWNAQTFELVKVIDVFKFGGHINSVNKVFWSSFNDWLISVSDDRTVMVWELEEEKN